MRNYIYQDQNSGKGEEIAGTEGAKHLAAMFKERGLSFEFIIDEGAVIARDQLAFLKGQPTVKARPSAVWPGALSAWRKRGGAKRHKPGKSRRADQK